MLKPKNVFLKNSIEYILKREKKPLSTSQIWFLLQKAFRSGEIHVPFPLKARESFDKRGMVALLNILRREKKVKFIRKTKHRCLYGMRTSCESIWQYVK